VSRIDDDDGRVRGVRREHEECACEDGTNDEHRS